MQAPLLCRTYMTLPAFGVRWHHRKRRQIIQPRNLFTLHALTGDPRSGSNGRPHTVLGLFGKIPPDKGDFQSSENLSMPDTGG